MIGIYKITSPSGKVYIGQSIEIERRIGKYKRLNCKKQIKLHRSLVKYGVEKHVFEVVLECDSSELNDNERYYQDLYDCVESGLNCTLTKSKDKSGKLSLEHRQKISKACKNPSLETRLKMSNSQKGKKVPREQVQRMADKKRGQKHSLETRLKMSEISRNISDETRIKKSIAATGKVQLEETKRKISETLKGRKHSEETKIKIASKHGNRVLNTETKEVFLSVAKAANSIGHNIPWLHEKLKGNTKNNTNLIYHKNE